MNKRISEQEQISSLKEKLEASYLDLLLQLSQIDYGEASLTCVIKENKIAFTGVSRTKNVMFDLRNKENSHG